MKILYVVSRPLEINTSASIRNRATIMGLIENGHDVDFITTKPDSNHIAFDGSMTLDGVKINYIELDGIQSVARIGRRFKFLAPLKQLAIQFMDSHNIYDNLKGIVDHASEVDLSEFDLIISSSDPKSSHLFVDKAIRQQGFSGRWIQIWGDPFLSDITLTNVAKKKEIQNEENRLLLACNKIVYVSKMTLESQKELYPDCADKMVYIPIPYLNEITESVNNFKTAKQIRVAYCGDYASNVRNILPLYEAVSKMEIRINLIICGNSDIELEDVSNITVLGRQPYGKVEEIERESDVLVHISNLYGNQIPGKIYQYSGTNKPILFILDGDKQNLREQFEIYDRYEFADNNVNSISDSINTIIENNKAYAPVNEFSKRTIADAVIK